MRSRLFFFETKIGSVKQFRYAAVPKFAVEQVLHDYGVPQPLYDSGWG